MTLRCFLDTVGADSGAVLDRDLTGTRIVSHWTASGDQPSISWAGGTLCARAFEASGVALDQAPASDLDCLRSTAAVAARFEHGGDHLGVIYGAFSEPLVADGRELERTTGSFASVAGLCFARSPALAATLCAPTVDALTGCLSYAGLVDAFLDEIARSRRYRHRLACCFIDLDGFKRVNDEHGHLEGNQVLRAVGAALGEAARRYDIVSRFGGDEFVVVLPETSGRAARAIAGRLRASVREAIGAATTLPIDASIGIADWDGELSGFGLIDAADSKLREAKVAGGGRIVGGTGGDRGESLVALTKNLARPWRGRQP